MLTDFHFVMKSFVGDKSRHMKSDHCDIDENKSKAGYTASPVACGWAGAVIEKVTWAFGQE